MCILIGLSNHDTVSANAKAFEIQKVAFCLIPNHLQTLSELFSLKFLENIENSLLKGCNIPVFPTNVQFDVLELYLQMQCTWQTKIVIS